MNINAKRLIEKQKKNLLFVLKFFVIFLTTSTLISFANLQTLTSGIAFLEAKMLSLPYYENLLKIDGEIFEINNHCIGLLSIAILASVIFALRKPELKKKIKIFFIGAVMLFPINVIRIAIVLLVGKNFGAEFAEIMHTISWFVMTGIIMLLWYYSTAKEIGKKGFKEII